jgi:hypothetical protein
MLAAVRAGLLVLVLFCSSMAANKPLLPVLRWSPAGPGCSAHSAQDGRTYYELSSGDLDVTLAVDDRELEKIPHRALPMFSALLTLHYRGKAQLAFSQEQSALEFVKHRQVLKTARDPDELLQRLQNDVDDLTDEVERHDIRRHPGQKEKKEAELQARLKDYTEMMDFISTHALRSTVLTPSSPAATGWLFFGVTDRWIGPWRKPEQFVLKVPLDSFVIEFPFSLPPQSGPVQLRHREQP